MTFKRQRRPIKRQAEAPREPAGVDSCPQLNRTASSHRDHEEDDDDEETSVLAQGVI